MRARTTGPTRPPRPERPRPSELLRQCNDWNEANPIGTHVRYFPALGSSDYSVERTDGLAFILSDHSAVVRLKFKAGCFALSNLQPMPEAAAE